MLIMLIDNHPLTQRRLQFIGISVNKLMLKSINIMQSSKNCNIVSSFIYWNQNIVHMKILDTSFKMTKIDLDLGGKIYVMQDKTDKTCINKLKNVSLQFLQGIRFNIFPFAPTITKII